MTWLQSRRFVKQLSCLKTNVRYCSSETDHRTNSPWRIMFFGSDNFSLKHLKVLHGNDQLVENLEVTVTGGKCPVEKYASEVGLPTHYWPLKKQDTRFDVGVIVSFGHLIPEHVINFFPNGILNVHPSLLPKWRGASPLAHTLLAGEKETGVTIMDIAASQFDVGPMLIQESFSIPDNCSAQHMEYLAAQHGSRLLIHCLQHLKTIERKHQEGKPSYAKKLKKKNTKINWDRQTAHDVDRQFRALSAGLTGITTGLRTKWNDKSIRLQDMLSLEEMQDPLIQNYLRIDEERIGDIKPGFLIYHKTARIVCIRCKIGWVGFKTVVVNKPMAALAFYNGYLSKGKNDNVCFESEENGLDKYWG